MYRYSTGVPRGLRVLHIGSLLGPDAGNMGTAQCYIYCIFRLLVRKE